jgi:DNA helicase-2/ATP-dependent DNA helicase PcrA
VLVRAGFQTRAFEERFVAIGLPYRVVGGAKFYERAEIRDAMAYMRVLHQPADDLAFERIINLPRRGIGDTTLRAFHAHARAHGVPLYAAAEALVDQQRGKVREALGTLLRGFAGWRATLARDGHVTTVAAMLDESGYTEMWRNDKSPEAPGRLENLRELVRALADFDSLAGFLEHVALVMENDEAAEESRVSLMTLHAAKGLEFDTVFLPGWEEGLFPNQRALDESGTRALEEERRLAYVGLTRARRRAIVSHAANRRIYANWQASIPSRFVDELPEEHTVRVGSEQARRSHAVAAPGWYTPGQRTGARLIDAGAWEQPARPARDHALAVGERVFHQKFGYGRVTLVDGEKIDVAFDKAGPKKLLDRFVEKA